MKLNKRIISICLLVAMLVPVMAVTASADYWFKYCFSNFKQIYQGTTETNYTKALQRFLYCFPLTHSDIADNGGVDGSFGSHTRSAVLKYQEFEFPLDSSEWDGYVGPKTWEKIGNRLTCEAADAYNYTFNLYYATDKVYYVDTRAEGIMFYFYYTLANDPNTVYKGAKFYEK